MDYRPLSNRSEYQVLATLCCVGKAQQIAEQNDPNHWDIHATLTAPPFIHFAVQVKAFTPDNLRLSVIHLGDWLQATIPTILAWWDDVGKVLYWADPLSVLLRTGGTVLRARAPIDEAADLFVLDPSKSESSARFIGRVRALSKIWPDLRSRPRAIGVDDEFPIRLLEAIQDPDVLAFLPLNRSLIDVIKTHGDVSKADLPSHMLRAARRSFASPGTATKELLKRCGISPDDDRVYAQVRASLLDWRQTIAGEKTAGVGRSLWAFETILSILEYGAPDDLKMPAFSVSHTYPLARFAKLLPADRLLEPLGRVLADDNRPEVLQYAAYCVGSLGFSAFSSPWEEVRELRLAIRKRAAKIGAGWSYVDRQLLFTEAKLGGERAQEEYLQRLASPAVAEFEVAYHLSYYEQNREAIRKRYERRLDANFKEDSNVRAILALCYNHLQKHRALKSTESPELRPELWTT